MSRLATSRANIANEEFNEYIKNEVARALVGEGVAPIYFVEVPGWQDKDFGQRSADWIAELRRRQHFDLRSWFHEGEQSLREAEVESSIEQLSQRIAERIQCGERFEQSLGNVDAHNPHFIGRTSELRRLQETVALKKIGVLAAVHGVGGMGKTALAIEYAHAFAHEYGGGRWQVRCEGREDLVAAITTLAPALGIEFTDTEKIDTELQCERVLAELRRLADAGEPHRCLLILDNVDRPALLEPARTQRLPADWLHVIATTRLGENDLFARHQDRAFVAVDEMPEADALDLIESYQPDGKFSRIAEREAAQEIVRLLGCFTLAVETAAVFLGQFAGDVTCCDFLERLKQEGLEGLESATSKTSEGVRHGEKRLTVTLQPTLERLSESERLALSYAALLPADQIALPWIRALVAAQYTELADEAEPGHPDAWLSILRQLLSLRLLQVTSILDSNSQPLVARMHRLLQELVRKPHEGWANSQAVGYLERIKSRWRARSVTRRARALTAALVQHAKSRAKFLRDGWKYPENQWEFKPLAACARQWMERGHKDAAGLANEVSVHLSHFAYFTESEDLSRRALAIDEKNFGTCHHIVALRLLSLADVLQDTNRLMEAEPLMRRALAIYEQLFGSDDDRVSLALNNLAQLLQDTNRLTEAEPLMKRALAIDEHNFGPKDSRVAGRLNNLAMLLQETNRFVDAEALMRRALAISEQSGPSNNPRIGIECGNLAQLLLGMNRLTEAEPLMKRALAINEQNFGPDHATVAMSLSNLGGLLKAQNRLTEAEELFERALIIGERRFGPDHPRVAIHLGNLASVLQATNRLTQAEQLQRRALAIEEQSFGPDHPNVALCLNNLATLLYDTNRLTEAEPLMKRALAIDQQSYGLVHPDVARDPTSCSMDG